MWWRAREKWQKLPRGKMVEGRGDKGGRREATWGEGGGEEGDWQRKGKRRKKERSVCEGRKWSQRSKSEREAAQKA